MAAARAELLIALFIVVQTIASFVLADCTIDLSKDYNVSSPLLLDKNTYDIIYPVKSSPKYLTFKSGEDHLIHCLGARLIKSNATTTTNSSNELTKCERNKTFVNPSKHSHYSFNEVSCIGSPLPIIKQDDGRKCTGNGAVVNIGYQVTVTIFKKIIDLCHVKESATTLWAHSKIPGVIGGYKSKEFNSPAFSKGSYFENISMSQVYPRSYQQQTFLTIFDNDTELLERYLSQEGKKKNYLVKGHLVARADLFYPAEQLSTYFYVNVLPMWQSINNGNWKSIEATVRRIASSLQTDLEVWTGGIGILRLSDRNIYLAKDKKNSSRLLMPVPKLLFKLVVRNGWKREAIAFVTANDPYIDYEEVPMDYKICQEYRACDRFRHFKNKFDGYTYCCTFEDFMASFHVKQLKLPVNFKRATPLGLF